MLPYIGLYTVYIRARVCLSIFRDVTYVDSEGIGWSINFSDTGGGGYGCISGCVISSPSKTKSSPRSPV